MAGTPQRLVSARRQHPSAEAGTTDAGPTQASGEDVAMLVVPDLFDVLDQLGDAVVTLDREYRIVAHNSAADRLGRRPAANIAPVPLWDAWTSPSGGTLQEDLRRAMSERIPLHTEHHVLDAAGEDIRLQIHILPTEPGLTVVARDITAQGHADRSQPEERARQLQELTAALSAALDPENVGAAIIERAMPALGANAGNVFLVDNTTRELRNVAVLGYEPQIAQWAQRLPLDGPTLVAEVARTGEPILLATWEERIARYPHHRRVHARGGDRAVAGLPLQVEGRTIGALSLAFPSDRAFDADDSRFMATVADLCAQALQRAELYEALRRSEERLELAQEAGRMGSWLLTLPEMDLACSARCKANFGLPPESDLSYRDLIAAVVPQDRDQARKTIQQAIDSGGDYDTRYRIRWPDGGVHWIMARGRVLHNAAGTPVSMIGVTVDVTAYQLAEEELQRQATLLDQAYDAMFASEWNGPITYWNKGAERMYGYTADEAVGRVSHELLLTSHGESSLRLLQQLEDHGVAEIEAQHTGKDGRRLIVESRHQVVVDAGRRYVLEANRDITERRHREARAGRLQELAAALAGALDPETIGVTVIEHVVPALGANIGNVYIRSDDAHALVSLAATGHAPDQQGRWQRVPVVDRTMVSEVARQGVPVIIETWGERLARYPHHSELKADQHGAAMGLPLRAGEESIGVVYLAFPSDRTFDDDDRRFVTTIADLCGQALERARLYEAARLSEARFRQLADAIPQIAWVTSGDGTTVEYLNKRWSDYTGLALDMAPGPALLANAPIHPDDSPGVTERWAEAFRAAEPFQSELRLRAADGTYHWFLSRSAPVRDGAGKIVKWFGTSTDIDDAKRVEANQRFLAELGQTLASSLDPEETLRRVVRLVVPGLADYCFADLIQADGQIRRVAWAHVDPDEQRIFDERLAQYLPKRFHPEHPISRTLETGEPQFVSNVTGSWLKRIAFSPEHLEFMHDRNFRSQMTIPLRARDRTVGALTFCMTGDSGRRFSRENLAFARLLAQRVALAVDNARLYTEARDAEAKVRRLLDAGVVGIIVTDLDRITEANDHFLEMVGYSRDELNDGRLLWREMTPPEYAEADARGIAELAERGVCTPFEKEYIRRDGSRIPILFGAAALQRDPPLSICFVLDLTERKRGEEEWRAFVDATAHDLRNPLTAVLGQTQLLQRRLRRDADVDRDDTASRLAAVASSAVRAAGLIDDLMDTARLRVGQPLELRQQSVDMVAIVRACAAEAQRISPTHLVLVGSDAFSLVVLADGSRIERVIRNMLDNAIKYSPAGGDIIVHARREEDEVGSWGVVTIEDRGLGIPASDLPYVFDRFRRGGNVQQHIAGSGIGLTGAKQIVAQHGGAISVQSMEGEGTTFTLRLPLIVS
jgi:PAS domain S-box-containing protein